LAGDDYGWFARGRRYAEKVRPVPYRLRLCPVIALHNSFYFFLFRTTMTATGVRTEFHRNVFCMLSRSCFVWLTWHFVPPRFGTGRNLTERSRFMYNGTKRKEDTWRESRVAFGWHEVRVFRSRIFLSVNKFFDEPVFAQQESPVDEFTRSCPLKFQD